MSTTQMKTRHILLFLAPFLLKTQLHAQLDFEKDVRPILRSNCFKCHGGPRAKKDFRMDKKETLAEHIGPDQYIVPGKPEESLVVKLISKPAQDTKRMPPPREQPDPLTEGEINTLKQWIKEGALLEPGDTPPAVASTDNPPPPAAMPDKDALHSWKSTSGKELKAYFVRIEDGNLVLRSEDGKEKAFPGKIFAPESIDLAKKLAGQ